MTEHIHCSYPLISWPLVVRAGFSWVGGTRVSPGLNVSLRPVRRGILLWMELFLAVEEEEEEEEVCDELSFLGIVERVGVELICKTHQGSISGLLCCWMHGTFQKLHKQPNLMMNEALQWHMRWHISIL